MKDIVADNIRNVVSQNFNGRLACSCKNISTICESLFPDEARSIQNSVARRKKEFAVGRSCARSALSNLNFPPCAIPVGESHEPIWPKKITGSISHDGDYCVAVAAFVHDIRLIGIDLAKSEPLDKNLIELICTPEDISNVNKYGEHNYIADPYKAIFSVKESIFKSLFPVVGCYFDFGDVSVKLKLDGTALIELKNDELFAHLRPKLKARYYLIQTYIFSIVWSI
ncbi:MAG: hypothetical protein COA78_04135 [Blastopirellula sp.]|nr:MAG: hypothetical protein COA78_04135 [Blastopirellula sp.]